MTLRSEITVATVLNDPATPRWLWIALTAAMAPDVDPVDAANSADVLAYVLNKRCNEMIAELRAVASKETRQ